MMNITPVVKQLLIINIIFYIGSNLVGDYAYELFSLYYIDSPGFKIWQFLTHMFMHAPIYMNHFKDLSGITHIVLNMYGLYIFGSALEHFWGAKRFLVFYILCGFGAALLQMGVNYYEVHAAMKSVSNLKLTPYEINQIFKADYKALFDENGQMIPGTIKNILSKVKCSQEQFNIISQAKINFDSTMVGASGALYGLLIAFAFMFPNAELMLIFIPFPIKAKYFVPVLVLIDLILGITGSSIFGAGIAHFAHVGGAVTGFLIMWYWRKNQFKHNRWN